MHVATIERMLLVRSAPSSSHVEPREQPIFATGHEAPELALAPVVGGLDVSVVEEEQQPCPLPVEVTEPFSERGLGRGDCFLAVDPFAQLVEDGSTRTLASLATLLRVVAGAAGLALDGEELGDDAHAFERDAVAAARGFDEASARVRPASRALAAGALEEVGDAGAVALHGAGEVVAEEAFDAVGVAGGRIEERHPAGIGPGPDGAVANAFGRIGIEHGDARRVGAEHAGAARLLSDEASDGREQIEGRGDSASEGLRCDLDARARESRALPLDGQVLDVLVARCLDQQPVGELATLDDLRRGRGRYDGVVVGAGDRLVEALLDEDAGRDDVENEAARMAR